ncbi:MAG: hypothetical protein AB7S38_08635 [Vulcanimicrobiota bacterium]
MNIESRACLVCGQQGLTVLEGPELEPICLECLRKADPAKAAVLERIFQSRGPQ